MQLSVEVARAIVNNKATEKNQFTYQYDPSTAWSPSSHPRDLSPPISMMHSTAAFPKPITEKSLITFIKGKMKLAA